MCELKKSRSVTCARNVHRCVVFYPDTRVLQKTVLHVTHFILCLEREIERHFGSFYKIGESRCIVEGKFMR
uniref:Wsv251 n=1 Tax=White spot syndrome virus TaxID=92652 RepID=A0A2U9G6I5_WSSV|nr:wsv251 [Shrimp white spot syndrome virus]AWQ60828.1 wsv251 [Shrimp white spot syndrome virus]AWQ61686.1 wsv251 [Shrimp white spot syndrome virus]